MTVQFLYAVSAARVKNEGSLVDVVKEIDVIVTGVDGDISFSLPITIKTADPSAEAFVPFESLAEQQILSWIDSDPVMGPIRNQVAREVANKASKQAVSEKRLPWVSEPAPLEAGVDLTESS